MCRRQSSPLAFSPTTTRSFTCLHLSVSLHKGIYLNGFVAPIWLLGQPTAHLNPKNTQGWNLLPIAPPKAFGFSPSNLALPNKTKSDFEVRRDLLWSLVPALGLEPRRTRPTGLKPDVSTNSTIPAIYIQTIDGSRTRILRNLPALSYLSVGYLMASPILAL